jgi:hypothetical protein
MYKITCPFSLISSHEILDVGFKGGNEINLVVPSKIESPLGINDVIVEFEPINKNKFNITVLSQALDTQQKQKDFLEKISESLSFLINRREHNPAYGTIFAKVDWYEFKALQIPENDGNLISNVLVSDLWGVFSTRPVNLDEFEWKNSSYHDVLRFYYDGLKAEHKKSKYFHWFLILEYLENSDRYKSLFNHNKLFDDNEKQAINKLADQMSDETKKSALKNLLSRTKEFRNTKLLKMINFLGIYRYKTFDKEKEINEEIIKNITAGRNAIFHSGFDFPESTLWNDLFPLATLVVEKVSNNPEILYN